MPDFKFDLGDIAGDSITGFEGVIISRSQWLNQCNTYGLQSKKLKDGVPTDRQYFDEPQLSIVKKAVAPKSQRTGGPNGAIPSTNRL